MNDQSKTREQLTLELEEMQLQLEMIDECRKDFEIAKEKYEKLLEAAPDAISLADNVESLIIRVSDCVY